MESYPVTRQSELSQTAESLMTAGNCLRIINLQLTDGETGDGGTLQISFRIHPGSCVLASAKRMRRQLICPIRLGALIHHLQVTPYYRPLALFSWIRNTSVSTAP